MPHFTSFGDLKNWLNTTWLPANGASAQLDGQAIRTPNRKVFVTFDLGEIPNLTAQISLHGDTTIEALRAVAASNIEDFIIVPPQRKATKWRLHLKGTHDYDNDETANGLYAYVK